MTDAELHVLDDPAAAVAELLADAARARRDDRPHRRLDGRPRLRARRRARSRTGARPSVWWGDERCVPPDDERSNYGLARRTLLDRLERQPEVHRIRGELAAGRGRRRVRARRSTGVELDLLLLGLGPDGARRLALPRLAAARRARRASSRAARPASSRSSTG